jgi:hypothetical protein
MPNFIGNRNDVLARGIKEITGRTPVKQMVPGAKARSLLETQAKEIENTGLLSELNTKKAVLPTTFGQFLSHWGATAGKSLYPETSAEVLAEDRAIRFFTRLGNTFGDINGGVSFTIPTGTILTAPELVQATPILTFTDIDAPDTDNDRSIHYVVTSPCLCQSDKKEAFCAARSLTPGTMGNLGSPNTLIHHGFSDYADYVGDSLLVTNTKPVLNGRSTESEASLRFRISKAIVSAETSNLTAMRQAALSVPGVADVVIIPFMDGPGRYNVYLKTISSVVSDRSVLDVQRALDIVKAVGCIGYARKPYEVGIEVLSTVTFTEILKAEIRAQILRILEANVVAYLNGLDLGQGLSFSALASELRNIDGRIKTLGSNPITVFDNVFVYYPARLANGGRRREKVIENSVAIPPHARIIAETSISDPAEFV